MSQDPAQTPAGEGAQPQEVGQQSPAPEAKKPRTSAFTPEYWARARVIYAQSDTLSPAKAAAQAANEMGLVKPPHHSSAAERAEREGWKRGGADLQTGAAPATPHTAPAPVSTQGNTTATPAPPGAAVPAEPQVDHMAGLTPVQVIFVNTFLTNLNGTRAYMAAVPTAKESTAATEAWKLQRNPKVAAAIHQRMQERIKRLEVDQDDVLRRYLTRLEADPRELVEFHRGACRHCHGEGHRYQFTPAELDRAKHAHEQQWKRHFLKMGEKGKDMEIPPFDEQGGVGFDARLDPNPECPECFGDGDGRVVIKDTRHLSPGALSLYCGVEEGKEGIKVKIGNRDDALLQVARHTGFFEADNEQTVFTAAAPEELDAIYDARKASAKARADKVKGRAQRLFGPKPDGDQAGEG